MKNFTPWRQLPELLLLTFLAEFLTDTKNLMNNLTFLRQKISLYEIIKSINSKANNKSPGSYILTAESYVHF